MKIALCAKGTFSLEFGSTKNRIELADGLRKLGWETFLIDKEILGIPSQEAYDAEKYSLALKEYLIENAHEFDVVLYEYDTLPFSRALFSKSTLFVARPALLAFHLPLTNFKYNLKAKLKNIYRELITKLTTAKNQSEQYYEKIDYCLRQCDLIQVQNTKDAELLVNRNFKKNNIEIIPNGVTTERIKNFLDLPKDYTEDFMIAYVGTFDFRKGAVDFPLVFDLVKKSFPGAKLKLLGTKGMFTDEQEVLNFFPKKNRSSIQVVPKFNASQLPELLKDCNVGMFPSYLESFGFGALEMMCAGLPVVAYDSPGPCDFILKDLLVPTGNYKEMANKLIYLLSNEKERLRKSSEAQELILDKYNWDKIAAKADQNYKLHITRKLSQTIK
jgi:glycosyltransferase involved in cell wall biosynthesis